MRYRGLVHMKSKEMKNLPMLRFPEFKNAPKWEEKVIKSILLDYKLGGNYSNSTVQNNYPLIKMGNIARGNIVLDKLEYINEINAIDELDKVEYGDLFLNTRNTLDLVGKVAIWKNELPRAYYNSNLMRMKYNNNFFMNYRLNSSQGIQSLRSIATGTTSVAAIYTKDLLNLKLFIPKPKEQQKIANFLSSIDELINSSAKKVETLKEHKKGLMQQLFPQDDEEVPKFRFPEFENAPKWENSELGSLISHFKGFAFQSKDYTATGRRIVRVSDMGYDYIKNETNATYINVEKAKEFEKWKLQKDDLIVTTVGSKPPVYDSLVGRSIVVKSKDENTLLNQNSVCLRANKKIEQGFLNTLFKRSEYVSFIESIIRGNANQGSIALSDLFKYRFFLPSPLEQEKIADCLSSLDKLITTQSKKVEALKEHKKGLMQQLFPSNKADK